MAHKEHWAFFTHKKTRSGESTGFVVIEVYEYQKCPTNR